VRLESEGKEKSPLYDANVGSRHAIHSVRYQRGKTQPAPSQAYDPNAVIWTQNTITARDKPSNRYDGSSGQITTEKKDVTNQHAYMTCLAGDRSMAQSEFTSLNGKVDRSVRDSPEEFTEMANWAFAQ